MDYLVPERAGRLAALREALLAHLRAAPESLIVIEEYDKLDCDARGLWRQLLQHPERANITWDRWGVSQGWGWVVRGGVLGAVGASGRTNAPGAATAGFPSRPPVPSSAPRGPQTALSSPSHPQKGPSS
jgi:hypothetical protein